MAKRWEKFEMIWVLLAAFFLGGGVGGVSGGILTPAAVKHLSERTEAAIADPARAEAARQTLVELREEVKAFEKIFLKSRKQLTRSYKGHAVDAGQVLTLLGNLSTDWEASQQHVVDLRFKFRDTLTEEEWIALFGGK